MNVEVIHEEFEKLLLAAERLTIDVDVVHMLKEGIERPLGAEEAQELLRRVVSRLERGAEARGDRERQQALHGRVDDLTAQAMAARIRIRAAAEAGPVHKTRSLELLSSHNGISRTPVVPRPVFHEKEIPMLGGALPNKALLSQLFGDSQPIFGASQSLNPSCRRNQYSANISSACDRWAAICTVLMSLSSVSIASASRTLSSEIRSCEPAEHNPGLAANSRRASAYAFSSMTGPICPL